MPGVEGKQTAKSIHYIKEVRTKSYNNKGTLTSIAHQYAQQHGRIRSSTLVTSLNRTCNRGDNHINHKDSQYDTGQFVFPLCTSGWFRQIRLELDLRQSRTHAEGLFPMEHRKHTTINEAMTYWKE